MRMRTRRQISSMVKAREEMEIGPQETTKRSGKGFLAREAEKVALRDCCAAGAAINSAISERFVHGSVAHWDQPEEQPTT